MNSKYLYLGWLFVLLFSTNAAFAAKCDTWACTYNPKPSGDDFTLPMPGNLQMVFKKVIVPGAEFWGNRERIVKMGDVLGDFGDNAIFEGVQRLPSSGSFYDWRNKHWYYYLGKYEVSVAQFVMVMGDGDKAKGLEKFYALSGDSKFTAQLKKAFRGSRKRKQFQLLAQPLTTVSWFDFQAFMRQYNNWCYKTPACVAKLPQLPQRLKANDPGLKKDDKLPGFFRLPTEIEWEYAARGGLAALKDQDRNGRAVFEHALPFSRSQFKQYAWANPKSRGKSPTIIGRWKPTYGFYDLFGNVQELTADLFRAESIQGKVGALTVRGGSFTHQARDIRVSMRSELDIYKKSPRSGKMIETQSHSTGIRLAIGSLVIRSRQFNEDIKTQYRVYKEGVRKDTAVGRSNNDPLMNANAGLKTAMDDLKKRNQQLKNQMVAMRQSIGGTNIQATLALINELEKNNRQLDSALRQASKQIEEGTLDVCEKLVSNAAVILKTAGWNYARASLHKKLIDKIKKMRIYGKTQKLQKATQNYNELVDAFESNFANYAQTVEKLGRYSRRFIEPAIRKNRTNKADDVIILEFLELVDKHVTQAMSGAVNVQGWKKDVQRLSLEKGVFLN